jgi:hypothetical protein
MTMGKAMNKRIASILFFACLTSCASDVEKTFEARSEKLNQMFQEYYNIPVHRKETAEGTVVWKGLAEIQSMYSRRRDELSALDRYYIELGQAKDPKWSDDAVLFRAVLHVLWTALNPEESTERNGISAIGQYLEASSAAHVEDATKQQLENVYFKKQEGYFDPQMSFEDNVAISLAIYQSQLHIKLNEYAKAVTILEGVAKKFPGNGYEVFLKGQTEAVKELNAGKRKLPEPPE